MKKIFFVGCIVLFALFAQSQATRVTITPEFPQRGDMVTVTYHPGLDSSGKGKEQEAVQLVFSYSNLYELPGKITMKRSGEAWTTSFPVPRYGVYATFYLQNGEWTDKPSSTQHYAIAVYNKKKRVENGYLYNGYSLPAQMGKAPGVKAAQRAMYEEELKNYPNNYEAKLRLLSTELNAGKTPEEEQLALKKGNAIIAERFYADPYKMGNINKVTMGYLIMGESDRLDSIRKVIVQRYPKGMAGVELRTGEIANLDDEQDQLRKLQALLKERTPANEEAFAEVHEMLFELFAKNKNSREALQHARSMLALQAKQNSPYIPVSLKSIAETLLKNKIALDSSAAYASRALALADKFPLGLIRYFPETGFIPSFVSEKDRKAGTDKAKANTLALLAMIRQEQKRSALAATLMKEALQLSRDKETLTQALKFYENTGHKPEAASAAWDMLMLTPNDTMALNAFKRTEQTDLLPAKMVELDTVWTRRMRASLNSERLNKKAPALEGLLDMEGNPVSAASLQNKIIILNFWATWCVPCMEEMPYMQKVYTQYKNNPDVVFLVTNSAARNTLQDAQKWAGRKKYDFPVYFASEPKLTEQLGFQVIPATFIIDKNGMIQFRMIGFEGATIEKKVSVAIELLKGV
ncbi:MAG: redoxin domain-containing protein [Chitinophagaceae bacterium]|nr:MAG: redoxin domain-containing protein [Chitinophagaceae bacterium]